MKASFSRLDPVPETSSKFGNGSRLCVRMHQSCYGLSLVCRAGRTRARARRGTLAAPPSTSTTSTVVTSSLWRWTWTPTHCPSSSTASRGAWCVDWPSRLLLCPVSYSVFLSAHSRGRGGWTLVTTSTDRYTLCDKCIARDCVHPFTYVTVLLCCRRTRALQPLPGSTVCSQQCPCTMRTTA